MSWLDNLSGGGPVLTTFTDFVNPSTNPVLGELTGRRQTQAALDEQRRATQEANALQRYMYDTTREDLAPWRQAGQTALGGLVGDDGMNADFMRDFSMADFQADPGYQFRMAEGMKALERSAAARGSLQSGATMKALTRYGQDMASQEYQNAYNRFNADRDRRFNRLASIAGLGQTAQTQTNMAGQNYANQSSQNIMGMGNANAAAHIAEANRMSGLAGQGIMGLTMFSDQRLKTNIEPVSKKDLEEMRRHLKAYSFRYVDPKFGEGDYVGVMAQDLEKSRLGRNLVFEDEHGRKKIDLHRVMMLFLATMAEAA